MRKALLAALAVSALCVAAPGASRAAGIAPSATATVADSGMIQNVRWTTRCHTEERWRYTRYGYRLVPERVCNRVWIGGPRWRGPWRDRDRWDRWDRYDPYDHD